MRIRKLVIRLPVGAKATAEHEARAIGAALGQALFETGGLARELRLDAKGHRGALLAGRVAGGLAKGPTGGAGHGS